MKHLLPTLLLLVFIKMSAMAFTAPSTSKFSEFADQMWQQGHKKEMLQIAETRLSRNPNDLASLLVCFDYMAGYMDVVGLEKLLPKIRTAEADIKTHKFSKLKNLILDEDIKTMERLLPTITNEMIEAESYKGDIPHRIDSLILIQALDDDGLVPPIRADERAIVEASISSTNSPISSAPRIASPSPILQSTSTTPISTESPSFPILPISVGLGILLISIGVFLFLRSRSQS